MDKNEYIKNLEKRIGVLENKSALPDGYYREYGYHGDPQHQYLNGCYAEILGKTRADFLGTDMQTAHFQTNGTIF